MGIRGKLFWLYLLTFGVMASLASWFLLVFLQGKFLELETIQGQQIMAQLLRNFEAEMTHLNDLNTDWSNWDGLYFYAQNHDSDFLQDELGAGALQSAKMNLMAIIDPQGKLLVAQAVDLANRRELPAEQFAPALDAVQAALKTDPLSKACGMLNVSQTSLLVCWQPIRRTDHGGEYVGSLIVARILDDQILQRIQQQSAIDFTVQPITENASTQVIKLPYLPQTQNVRFMAAHDEILSTQLLGLTGKPVLEINMRVPDDLRRNGHQIILWVMSVLILVVALTGGCLILGVHLLLVRRINSLDAELNEISSSNLWDRRIESTKGHDELSSLSRDINHLLQVIDGKLMSLQSQALTDPLTEIANRRAFDQRLEIELEARKRSGLPLALMALDVDYFKLYNDTYGHPAGDLVLKTLGQLLSHAAARPTDLPARVGGEEFAILMPNTSLEGAEILAKRLCEQLAEENIPHRNSQVASHLTISIGVTVAGNDSPEQLVARADSAVYLSKTAGRNRITTLLPEADQAKA